MTLSKIPYIRWAKDEATRGQYLLTASAVPPLDWEALGMDPSELELFQYSRYGDAELMADLAGRWGLEAEELLLASSTTHAHFCFAASSVSPGDRILYERPGYTPLIDALSLLRVEPIAVERTFEAGYSLPLEQLEEQVKETGARLLLLTHLHNPSGVALTGEEIEFLAGLCERTGLEILCDETYRPFLDPDPGPIHLQHPSIISVGGLNKVHGMPQIRIGWGFASPERVERARRILDATTIHNSCLSDQVARFAVQRMPELEERARRIGRAGWQVLEPVLLRSPLEFVGPAGGIVCFPRVPPALFTDGDELRDALLQVGVGVTPGRFFQASHHIRVGFGSPESELRPALIRLEEGLSGRKN